MPYYCTVPRCTSMAGKAKNVSFHQFPRDEELAMLWNKILKRGKPYTKYSKVCSLHFRPEDYTITSVGKNKGQWRTLRKDAIPSQNLPSESPVPNAPRRNSGAWVASNVPTTVIDARMQQQMAQAIYMQTMLAMQAANGTLPTQSNTAESPTDLNTPHSSNFSITDLEQILKHTPKTLDSFHEKQEILNQSTSFKCEECSKCFKDPDVFVLHRRSHSKTNLQERLTETLSVGLEKENFNSNSDLTRQETLRANPILANLLKSGISNTSDLPNPNVYGANNIASIENHIMAALAANMESYIRNLSSILSHHAADDAKNSHPLENTQNGDLSRSDDDASSKENFDDENHCNDMDDSSFQERNSLMQECHSSIQERRSSEQERCNSIQEPRISEQEFYNSIEESDNLDSCNLVQERRDLEQEPRDSEQEFYNSNQESDNVESCNSVQERRDLEQGSCNSLQKTHNSEQDLINFDCNISNSNENVKEQTCTFMNTGSDFEMEPNCDNEDLNDSKDSINLIIDENA